MSVCVGGGGGGGGRLRFVFSCCRTCKTLCVLCLFLAMPWVGLRSVSVASLIILTLLVFSKQN